MLHALDQPLDLKAGGRMKWIHINGHQWSPQAEVWSDCGAAGVPTRTTGVYTPLDRTARTALPACTYEGPQPLARDPAGAGGVARANPGWNGLTAETAVSRAGRAWTKMWRYRNVPFYGHSL